MFFLQINYIILPSNFNYPFMILKKKKKKPQMYDLNYKTFPSSRTLWTKEKTKGKENVTLNHTKLMLKKICKYYKQLNDIKVIIFLF